MQVHLVRHGHHPLLGRLLCGRRVEAGLDDIGHAQSDLVGRQLSRFRPVAVQSSPRRRTLQSAAAIARHCRTAVEVVDAVDEIDMGCWTGQEFTALEADPAWVEWNERRGSAVPPGGESMSNLQRRVVGHLEQLRAENTDAVIAIVSHAEPIRAALMYYLGIPLDKFFEVTVDPASISTLTMSRRRTRVARLNGALA